MKRNGCSNKTTYKEGIRLKNAVKMLYENCRDLVCRDSKGEWSAGHVQRERTSNHELVFRVDMTFTPDRSCILTVMETV